jgi:ligand-binding sensor domain-containing protein/serine phosphatase RsbU (regulator of sigma subunit)
MKRFIIIWLVSILALACSEKNKKTLSSFGQKIYEANSNSISIDSLKIKRLIPINAVNSKTIIIDKAKPDISKPASRSFSSPKKIIDLTKLPTPQVCVMGKGKYELPKNIPLKKKIALAGLPQVKLAGTPLINKNQPNFFNFTVSQGLKNGRVVCFLQDRKGNLWFGTQGGGVSRFDGKNFSHYTVKEGLSDDWVMSIYEDKTGNLWFGTNKGISILSSDGKLFTYFSETKDFCRDAVDCIIEDKNGIIWLGTECGLYKVNSNQESLEFYSADQGIGGLGRPNNGIQSILEDSSGDLWLGISMGLTRFKYKSGEFTNYTPEQGICPMIFDSGMMMANRVSSIAEDNDGNLWLACDDGVYKFNKDRLHLSHYIEKENLLSNLHQIFIDKKKNIYACSFFYGLSVISPGNNLSHYNEENGLITTNVNCITEDRNGNIWVGTEEGLCLYASSIFKSYPIRGIMSSDAFGNLWNEIDGQLFCQNKNGERSVYDCRKAFGPISTTRMTVDKSGDPWIASYNGIYKFNVKNNSLLHINLSGPAWCVTEDSHKNTWIGTSDGAYCFNGARLKYFTKEFGLINNDVQCIFEGKQNEIWFGTINGVSKYDGKQFKNYYKNEELINNKINSITSDSYGNTWFGTDDGLLVLDKEEKKLIHFTEENGLPGNIVKCLIKDKQGNIWIGTHYDGSTSLSCVKRAMLNKLNSYMMMQTKNIDANFFTGFFYNYTSADVFMDSEISTAFEDLKGRIWWLGTSVKRYTPENEIIDTAAPIINLTNLKLFEQNILWSNLGAVSVDSLGNTLLREYARDSVLSNGVELSKIKFDGLSDWFRLPIHLSLPYINNNITFGFNGIHLSDRNHIKFQYILEGQDEHWSNITNENEAHYGNLLPGRYVFKVKGANRSGVWSVPLEYSFEVRPPWWQTLWFRIVVLITIISSIVFYIKSRERALKVKQRELEVKIDEATSEIKEQKHLIEEKHNEIKDSINYAERIQRSFLATKELLDDNLKEYFIFFKPKDVVSGDFYLASKLNNDQFALVIADSTGHGVPGAIMSLLNITSLEKAIENLIEPADILNHTRKTIIERLKKDGSIDGGKDGMDCSLISFDFKNSKLTYSAANNPVWIVRENTILEFGPDKMPVGKHDRDNIPFTQHEISLQKNDVVYAITDGFADQFGGPLGKKFMYKKLKELLISIANDSMSVQKQKLIKVLGDWKGNLEQVDDITLIGIRI